MKINHKEFWDTNYYQNPSLTDEMVAKAENELGVKLPPLFIELLKIQNGGYTQGFAFPMKQSTSWSENHVPLQELFGIVTDKSSDSGHNILMTDYLVKEWGLPEKQVLLTGDGHWWITLDYREGEAPKIRWIDCEINQDIHIADSFDEFFNGLIPDYEVEEL